MEMDGKHKVLLRETGLDNEELLVSMVTQLTESTQNEGICLPKASIDQKGAWKARE